MFTKLNVVPGELVNTLCLSRTAGEGTNWGHGDHRPQSTGSAAQFSPADASLHLSLCAERLHDPQHAPAEPSLVGKDKIVPLCWRSLADCLGQMTTDMGPGIRTDPSQPVGLLSRRTTHPQNRIPREHQMDPRGGRVYRKMSKHVCYRAGLGTVSDHRRQKSMWP